MKSLARFRIRKASLNRKIAKQNIRETVRLTFSETNMAKLRIVFALYLVDQMFNFTLI